MTKRGLKIVSGLLWTYAGYKILKKGIPAIIAVHWAWTIICAVLVLAFFLWNFRMVSTKYCLRIDNLEGERFPIYRFMSLKGYLLIGFMMGLGIGMSYIPGMPTEAFCILYPGLGLGLWSGALRFFVNAIGTKVSK